VKYIMHIR
jgi:hypothetical protein